MTIAPLRRARAHLAVLLAVTLFAAVGIVLQTAPAANSYEATPIQPGQSQVQELVAGDSATASFTVQPPATGSMYVGVRVRVSAGSFYLLQARVSAADKVSVSLKRTTPSGTTDLAPSQVTSLDVSTGGSITLSLAATGTSPVLAGVVTANGVTHRVSHQDAAAGALTSTGGAQSWSYVSGSATGVAYSSADALHITPAATVTLPTRAAKVWPTGERADGVAAAFAMGLGGSPLGTQYLGVRVRVDGESYYLLQAAVSGSGSVRASLKRVLNGVATDLVPARDIGLTVKPGDSLVLRLVAGGGSNVSLSGSIGIAGTSASGALTFQDTAATRLAAVAGTAAWALIGSNPGAGVTVGYTPVAASASTAVAPGTGTPAPSVPAPQPTPAPSPAVGPAIMPSASNTGVPAGTTLKVHEGDLVINEPNTVISGMEIRGLLVINASGAVIEKSRIVGRDMSVSAALVTNYRSKASFIIRDSEIVPRYPSPFMMAGIMGSNFTAERLNVHGLVDGIRITGDNTTVSASWLHDNLHYDSDPVFGGEPSHDDSIQIQAGRNITISGNRADGNYSAALMVTQDLGTISNVSVTRNYLGGGSCTVNVSDTVVGIQNVSITSNVFGPVRRIKDCAIFAPLPTVLTTGGNVWENSTAPISVVQRF